MRVSVEKPFVEDLRCIVVNEFCADLIGVIAFIFQQAKMRYRRPLDIIHNHNMLRAQPHIRPRAVHICIAFSKIPELLQVFSLDHKISRRLESIPQLINYAHKINDLGIL